MLRLFLKPYPILLLDEPTNHLDDETAVMIIDQIFSLPSTKLIITHDERLLRRIDHVYLLKNHRLVRQQKGGTNGREEIISHHS